MGLSNINRSPLDGVVNAIDAVRHGKRKVDQKVKDIKGAPRRKIEELKAKAAPTRTKCEILGHKGSRGFGKHCSRCGCQLL